MAIFTRPPGCRALPLIANLPIHLGSWLVHGPGSVRACLSARPASVPGTASGCSSPKRLSSNRRLASRTKDGCGIPPQHYWWGRCGLEPHSTRAIGSLQPQRSLSDATRPVLLGYHTSRVVSTPCGITPHVSGGAEEDRTPDILLARQTLSRLSYSPTICVIVR